MIRRGGRSRARIAVLAALASAAVGAAGCSLLLDFAPGADGGPGDDAGSDAGAAVNCTVGEPNDTVDAAGAIDDSVAAAICADGPDYWSFEVDGAQDVAIELTFTAGANDLEMQLLSMEGEVLTISTGTDANEQIEQSSALGNQLEAGTYIIAVLGRETTAENDYQLAVEIDTPTPDAGP
ncbi:MAG TPA: hypothetical protein VMZ28_01620 [Kofleriaceae bacterium]|nr:hypothetical protein [Kofleriaceae bacterium]